MGDLIKVEFNQHHKKAKTSKFREVLFDKVIPAAIVAAFIAELGIVTYFMSKSMEESFSPSNSTPAIVEQVDSVSPDYEIVEDNNNLGYTDDFQSDDITFDEGGHSR